MPLIEGIGDEVTFVFAALLVIIIVVCAWLSTHTRDIPFFRLLIVDLTRRRNRSPEPAVSNDTASTEDIPQGQNREHTPDLSESDPQGSDEQQGEERNTHTEQETPPSDEGAGIESEIQEAVAGDTGTVSQCDTNTQCVDKDIVRQSRLEFFSKEKESDIGERLSVSEKITDDSGRPASVPENHTTGASVDGSQSPVDSEPSIQASVLEEIELNDGNIRVKLKYLNDTQRLVQTSPLETLGQFKQNHFGPELADNKLVRLIYNGQCLQNDTSTLQSYNIQDNCTVHCLVTEARQQSSTPPTDTRNDADMSMFMFPMFAFFLATVWYFRVAYRQYFNATATFSLVGITFLFTVAMFSTWRARQGREEHQHLD